MDIGDPLPNSPTYRYYFAADYTFPMEVLGGKLWTRIDYSAGDTTYNSIGAATAPHAMGIIPSWDVTNLQFGLTLPSNWEITLFINNMFDDRIENGISDGGWNADWWGDDRWRNIRYLQRPQHYGLTVRKSWK